MKPKYPIKSILFDLDNTLIDRTGGFRRFCVDLYRSNSAINEVSTQKEAIELMVELDQAGLNDRHQLFDRIISRWPGAFRHTDDAVGFYMETYPRLLTLAPETGPISERPPWTRCPLWHRH